MREKIQQFLDYITVEKGYSQNTLAAYRNDLSQFMVYLAGRVSTWDEVTRDTILAYIMHMKAEQEYASSTVARGWMPTRESQGPRGQRWPAPGW